MIKVLYKRIHKRINIARTAHITDVLIFFRQKLFQERTGRKWLVSMISTNKGAATLGWVAAPWLVDIKFANYEMMYT